MGTAVLPNSDHNQFQYNTVKSCYLEVSETINLLIICRLKYTRHKETVTFNIWTSNSLEHIHDAQDINIQLKVQIFSTVTCQL